MSLNRILTKLELSRLIKVIESQKDHRVSDGISGRMS